MSLTWDHRRSPRHRSRTTSTLSIRCDRRNLNSIVSPQLISIPPLPQLLEEMLDEGYPLTTESNLLRDIVLPPTLLSKVLSAAGVSG